MTRRPFGDHLVAVLSAPNTMWFQFEKLNPCCQQRTQGRCLLASATTELDCVETGAPFLFWRRG